MLWQVDKYKITFKLVINHCTNEILVTDTCYTCYLGVLGLSFSPHSRILFSSEYFHYKIFINEKWQIPGQPLAARYNWCQFPAPGRGPAVEKHWSKLLASLKFGRITLITRRPSPAVSFTTTWSRVAEYVRIWWSVNLSKNRSFNGRLITVVTTALFWPCCGPSQSGPRSLGRGVENI